MNINIISDTTGRTQCNYDYRYFVDIFACWYVSELIVLVVIISWCLQKCLQTLRLRSNVRTRLRLLSLWSLIWDTAHVFVFGRKKPKNRCVNQVASSTYHLDDWLPTINTYQVSRSTRTTYTTLYNTVKKGHTYCLPLDYMMQCNDRNYGTSIGSIRSEGLSRSHT